MVKRNLFNGLTLLIISFLIFLSSCSKDDPVTPIPIDSTYDFDSSRYTWTKDSILNQFTGELFGLDTSHVYIIGTHSLTFFDGNSFSRYNFGDLYFSAIDGVDPQHIYIAGAYPNGNYRLMKFDGSTYLDIPVPSDTVSQLGGFTSVSSKSQSEIWVGGKGKIFLCNGINWVEYDIDSTFTITSFAELDGKMLAVAQKSHGIKNSDFEQAIYKFENNFWNRIFHKYYYFPTEPMAIIKFDNKLYGSLDKLLKFTGSDFAPILTPPNNYEMAVIASGSNENQFLTLLFKGEDYFYSNWNGSKWSREISVNSPINMKKIGKNYYIIDSPCSSCNFVYLLVGRPNLN